MIDVSTMCVSWPQHVSMDPHQVPLSLCLTPIGVTTCWPQRKLARNLKSLLGSDVRPRTSEPRLGIAGVTTELDVMKSILVRERCVGSLLQYVGTTALQRHREVFYFNKTRGGAQYCTASHTCMTGGVSFFLRAPREPFGAG